MTSQVAEKLRRMELGTARSVVPYCRTVFCSLAKCSVTTDAICHAKEGYRTRNAGVVTGLVHYTWLTFSYRSAVPTAWNGLI